MAIMFKVGATDYSNRVISGTFKVQTNDLYEEWTDANGRTHRMGYTTKTSGSFNIFFKTIEEYQGFMANLIAVRHEDLSYPVTVLDNISSTEKSIDAFLDFEPVRGRDEMWNDKVEILTINLMEC